ncbi:MAG: cytochrome c biogenesis protein CcdA [Dehalococcoidia bacterium]|jgi:cytochrome c biogenesis protein CcdA|nr:cytochrome c biogenesis protein CcdA [Dehalococcoidia bacterium]
MLDSLLNVPVAFAFGAGMVAAFNPCGAAMLPAYIGYQLSGGGETTNPLKAVIRGFYLGGVVTSGFVVLSLAVGFIITIGGDAIFNIVPFAGLGVGVGIALLGLCLLISGKHMGIWTATRVNRSNERSVKGVFLFGVAYAICSLGCAFPVFLAAVGILAGQNLGDLDILTSLLRFASYGLGMGMILTGVTLGVVFFRDTVSQILGRVFPYIGVAGNLALMGAGSYLIWYWTLGAGGELLTMRLEKLF